MRLSLYLLLCFWPAALYAQTREEIHIPPVPGYQTIKCDLHMHTVFSDGKVWPTMRVEEAWREGLDCISITEHVEYQSHKEDVIHRYGRAYELALPAAKHYDLLLIKGAEITRSMPPGHLNALFLEKIEPLNNGDAMESIKAAGVQNAFIFWNHPGNKWYSEHTELLENNLLHGAEVVNGNTYYPEVHQWILDKGLTLICNSDIHDRVDYKFHGDHRPITLAFVKERSIEGVKEALRKGRTAGYFKNSLIGEKKYLEPIFHGSIEIKNAPLNMGKDGRLALQVYNRSDLEYQVETKKTYGLPESFVLPAKKTVLITPVIKEGIRTGENLIRVPVRVKNMIPAPNQALETELLLPAFSLSPLRVGRESDGFKIQAPGLDPDLNLFYALDNKNLIPISKSFRGQGQTRIKVQAFKGEKAVGRPWEKDVLLHKALGADIKYKIPYSTKYAGSLTDGIRGSLNFKDGNWQGYEGEDMHVILDLKTPKPRQTLSIGFLENQGSWIFGPLCVEIAVAVVDGEFIPILKQEFEPQPAGAADRILSVDFELKEIIARYIRIRAKNLGQCPDWHPGAGKKAWLFADEIEVL